MKKVAVIYQGHEQEWTLGHLADNGQHILFEYSATALDIGLELSPIHLKLQKEAYKNFPDFQMKLPGLISDSLPDGWGLLLMDKWFRKNGINPLSISPLDRLSLLGDRAMGALAFSPHQEVLLSTQQIQLLEVAKEIQKTILDKSNTALLELVLMGGSPQGARPKVLVNYDEQKDIITNDLSLGEPWIVKFPAKDEHKEACAIEELYAQCAKKSGLLMTETKYFDLDKKLSAFGTKRFDRKKEIKIPIHTLSGILHSNFRLPSSSDYLNFLRVTKMITNSDAESLKAFHQCVFNVVFNNRDDHSKNFSFQFNDKNQWVLSPAYDITFNFGPGGEHQMDIMGEGKNPTREHLMILAQKAGLNNKPCERIIEQVLTSANSFKQLAQDMPIRKKTITSIQEIILKNMKNCSK